MNLLAKVDADLRDGRVSEAVLALRGHIVKHPGDAAAIERLAFAYHQLGDLQAAAAAFESLTSILPSSASAASNFATVLGQMQRYDEALHLLDRAISLDGDFTDARFNRAQILELRGRRTDALDDFRHVVETNPGHKVAWYRLGHLLINAGRREEGQLALDRATALDPDYAEARWARTMSTLPQAYGIGEAPEPFYEEFSRRLASLDRWFADGRDASGHRAVGNQQPYYIVYHERNNRDVLSRYGDLCARLMNAWYGARPPVPGLDGKGRSKSRSCPAMFTITRFGPRSCAGGAGTSTTRAFVCLSSTPRPLLTARLPLRGRAWIDLSRVDATSARGLTPSSNFDPMY